MICHINLAKGYRGGERQTEILILELSNKGFEQKVFIRKNSALKSYLENISNLTIVEISKPYFFNLYKFKNCSIIHAHEKKAEQLAWFINMIFKIPYFVTRRVNKLPKNNILNHSIYKNAVKVFVLSSIMKKDIDKRFNIDTKIIPDASSNLSRTNEINNLKKKYKNKFIITNIGALVNKDKGQEYIIKTANLLRGYQDIVFVIVGDGKDKDYYLNLINKYNLYNIELVGFKKNVGDYLEISDIFLFPSLNEGLGSILIDAMEFGKTIITTQVGGIPDLIKNNYNGILISEKNEIDIRDKILELYHNKPLREYLSYNAKIESQKYQMTNLVNEYINNYKAFI